MLEYSYRKGEFVVIYNDAYTGERTVEQTDTLEQATKILNNSCYPVGVMTTSLYNHYIAEK